jgi:hypothetical protein
MSGGRNKFGKDKENGVKLETKLALTYFISRTVPQKICEGHLTLIQARKQAEFINFVNK